MKGSDFSNRGDYWQGVIADQKRSGLKQSEYCRQNRIPLGSFSSWKTTLKKGLKSKSSGSTSRTLARVQIEPSLEPVRIQFPSGASLHFSRTPDPNWIQQLLKLVS